LVLSISAAPCGKQRKAFGVAYSWYGTDELLFLQYSFTLEGFTSSFKDVVKRGVCPAVGLEDKLSQKQPKTMNDLTQAKKSFRRKVSP
jgi:hypothetical protein